MTSGSQPQDGAVGTETPKLRSKATLDTLRFVTRYCDREILTNVSIE